MKTNLLLSVNEAAEALSISVREIEARVEAGEIGTVQVGSFTLYPPSELERFAERMAQQARRNRQKNQGAT